jgi:hypothetical protein
MVFHYTFTLPQNRLHVSMCQHSIKIFKYEPRASLETLGSHRESSLLFLFADSRGIGSAFHRAEESDIASFYGSSWYLFFGLNVTEGLKLSG